MSETVYLSHVLWGQEAVRVFAFGRCVVGESSVPNTLTADRWAEAGGRNKATMFQVLRLSESCHLLLRRKTSPLYQHQQPASQPASGTNCEMMLATLEALAAEAAAHTTTYTIGRIKLLRRRICKRVSSLPCTTDRKRPEKRGYSLPRSLGWKFTVQHD